MSLEFMLQEMLQQIRECGGLEINIVAYLAEWRSAIKDFEKPLPCPLCFLKGKIYGLNHLDDEKGLGKVRCTRCRKYFIFSNTM
jgi:RecJ-like exonuclease